MFPSGRLFICENEAITISHERLLTNRKISQWHTRLMTTKWIWNNVYHDYKLITSQFIAWLFNQKKKKCKSIDFVFSCDQAEFVHFANWSLCYVHLKIGARVAFQNWIFVYSLFFISLRLRFRFRFYSSVQRSNWLIRFRKRQEESSSLAYTHSNIAVPWLLSFIWF